MDKFRLVRQNSTFSENDGSQGKYHKGQQAYAIHSDDKQAMKAMIILININFDGCLQYHEDFSDYYVNGEAATFVINNEDVSFFKERYKIEKKYLNS